MVTGSDAKLLQYASRFEIGRPRSTAPFGASGRVDGMCSGLSTSVDVRAFRERKEKLDAKGREVDRLYSLIRVCLLPIPVGSVLLGNQLGSLRLIDIGVPRRLGRHLKSLTLATG